MVIVKILGVKSRLSKPEPSATVVGTTRRD
jgi:hypothetical protein